MVDSSMMPQLGKSLHIMCQKAVNFSILAFCMFKATWLILDTLQSTVAFMPLGTLHFVWALLWVLL